MMKCKTSLRGWFGVNAGENCLLSKAVSTDRSVQLGGNVRGLPSSSSLTQSIYKARHPFYGRFCCVVPSVGVNPEKHIHSSKLANEILDFGWTRTKKVKKKKNNNNKVTGWHVGQFWVKASLRLPDKQTTLTTHAHTHTHNHSLLRRGRPPARTCKNVDGVRGQRQQCLDLGQSECDGSPSAVLLSLAK